MVFQNYALYPHMSVFDNIAFPLQIAKMPKAEIQKRVVEAARILELEAYLKRRPGQLSGGQRQRVAMGRAIVRQPAVFLMDEPLSNLDAKLRVQMRAEIAQLQHRLGTTTIYVTHDQVEAMTMGHRVALLKDGVLQQVDTPSGIYDRPVNMFVAAFIGAPTMNLFYGTLGEVTAVGHQRRCSAATSIAVPAAVLAERPGLVPLRRPARRRRHPARGPLRSRPSARPRRRHPPALDRRPRRGAGLGRPRPLRPRCRGGDRPELGLAAGAQGRPQRRAAPSPGSARAPTPRSAARSRSAIDVSHLHFFDPETTQAIRQ